MLQLIVISSVAGVVGTGLGGVLGTFFGQKSESSLSNVLSFAAGVMISVVCFDLMPEAAHLVGLPGTAGGLLLGIFIIMGLNYWVDKVTATSARQMALHTSLEELHHEEGLIARGDGKKRSSFHLHQHHHRHHHPSRLPAMPASQSMYRAGVIMLLAIALHNLPEGVAIGSGSVHDTALGLSLAALIALHNIPEGMAIAAPLTAGGVSRWLTIVLTCLSGAATILGGMLGFWLGGISEQSTAICIAFAGGAMLYVVFGEIIPQSIVLQKDRAPALTTLFGFILGWVFTQY